MNIAIVIAAIIGIMATSMPAQADEHIRCRKDSSGTTRCTTRDRNPGQNCETICRTDSAGHVRCVKRCR